MSTLLGLFFRHKATGDVGEVWATHWDRETDRATVDVQGVRAGNQSRLGTSHVFPLMRYPEGRLELGLLTLDENDLTEPDWTDVTDEWRSAATDSPPAEPAQHPAAEAGHD